MDRIPQYRLEIRLKSGRAVSSMEWRVRTSFHGKGFGKPSRANAIKWIADFESSLKIGPNRHLGPDQVTYLRVVNQRTGEVMIELQPQ